MKLIHLNKIISKNKMQDKKLSTNLGRNLYILYMLMPLLIILRHSKR